MTEEVVRKLVDGVWVTTVERQDGGNGGSQPLKFATIPVSSGDILVMKDTPKVLITPATDCYVWPVSVYCNFHFGTTPYTTGNLEMIQWLGCGVEIIAPTGVPCFAASADNSLPWGGLADGTGGLLPSMVLHGGSAVDTTALIVDVPLVLTVDSGSSNPSGGDGTATFIIGYYEIDTTL